jgi:hypothetical protein
VHQDRQQHALGQVVGPDHQHPDDRKHHEAEHDRERELREVQSSAGIAVAVNRGPNRPLRRPQPPGGRRRGRVGDRVPPRLQLDPHPGRGPGRPRPSTAAASPRCPACTSSACPGSAPAGRPCWGSCRRTPPTWPTTSRPTTEAPCRAQPPPPRSYRARRIALTEIALFLYDGMTALDAVGPYGVLARLPGAQVKFVASTPGPKQIDVGLVLTADASLADVPTPTSSSSPARARCRSWRTRQRSSARRYPAVSRSTEPGRTGGPPGRP